MRAPGTDSQRPLLRRRKFLGFLAGFFGVLGAWRFRLPQVVLFATASAARHFRARGAPENFPPVGPPSKTPSQESALSSHSAVTYHPWYHQFRVDAARVALQQAAALGVGFIRTDVRWADFYPDGGTLSGRALRWYEWFFSEASARYAIRPLIVLGSPPASFRSLSEERQLDSWGEYTRAMAAAFAPACSMFQVLNEPNNPVYSLWPLRITARAIRFASDAIRAVNPSSSIAITFACDLPNWRRYLTSILPLLGTAVDVIGLDSYPETWSTSAAGPESLLTLLDTARKLIESIGLGGYEVGIMETGYATNIPHFRDGASQAAFFTRLLQALTTIPRNERPHSAALLGLYELCDQDSTVLIDPEATFGLVRSDLRTRKAAFNIASDICKAMTW